MALIQTFTVIMAVIVPAAHRAALTEETCVSETNASMSAILSSLRRCAWR